MHDWWLRLGAERVEASEACSVDGCGAKPLPVEAFCPEHSEILVFPAAQGERRRWLIANILRIATIASIGFAADWVSPVPIFLLAVVAAGALLAVRLRAFPVARIAAAIVGAIAAVSVLVLGATEVAVDDRIAAYVGTTAVVIAVCWIVFMVAATGALVAGEESDAVAHLAARAVAVTLGTAPAALALWVVSNSIDAPETLNDYILGMAVGAAAGAVMVAATASAVRSYRRIPLKVIRKFHRRPKPAKLDLAAAPTRALANLRSSAHSRHRRFELFGTRLQVAIVSGISGALDVLRAAATRLQNQGTDLLEAIHRLAVRARRRALLTTEYSILCLRDGWTLLAMLAARYLRALAVPAIGLVVAAAAAWSLAGHLVGYLNDGPISDAILAALLGIVVLLGAFAAWTGWSTVPVRSAAMIELRDLETMAPDALLLFVAGGWVLGIAGWLGFGPVVPGALTISATALLLVFVVTQGRWRDAALLEAAPTAQPFE